jgi:hypothetical protein
MNLLGLMFGFAVARGLPDASRIALVSGMIRPPVFSLVLASTLANRERRAAPVIVHNTETAQRSAFQKRGQKAAEARAGED